MRLLYNFVSLPPRSIDGYNPKTIFMTRFIKASFLCVMVLLAAAMPLSVAAGDGKIVSKNMKVGNFDEIEVSGNIEVTYTKGSGLMKVTGPAGMVKRLKAKVESGTLKLSLTNQSGLFSKNNGKGRKVKISVLSQRLDELDASSGAVVNVKSPVNAPDDFEIDASSGAVVIVGSIIAPKCGIDVSSGAVVNVKSVDVGKISVDSSSGAVLSLPSVKATTVNVDMSGGSVTDISGQCGTLNVDISGGAVGSLKGLKAKVANIDASGGAVLDYSAAKASVDKGWSSVVSNHR